MGEKKDDDETLAQYRSGAAAIGLHPDRHSRTEYAVRILRAAASLALPPKPSDPGSRSASRRRRLGSALLRHPCHVGIDHPSDQGLELGRAAPAQLRPCFFRISTEDVHFRGPIQLRIDHHAFFVVETGVA